MLNCWWCVSAKQTHKRTRLYTHLSQFVNYGNFSLYKNRTSNLFQIIRGSNNKMGSYRVCDVFHNHIKIKMQPSVVHLFLRIYICNLAYEHRADECTENIRANNLALHILKKHMCAPFYIYTCERCIRAFVFAWAMDSPFTRCIFALYTQECIIIYLFVIYNHKFICNIFII